MEPLETAESGQEPLSVMEEWVGDYDYSLPERGEIREGIIVTIESHEIVVDIGVKRDGIVPLQDLQMLGEEEVAKLQVGEAVNVCVLKPEDAQGNMIVSINIARKQKDWVKAEEMQESGEIFEEDVIDFNKGGLLVPFGQLRAFIPASQLSDLPRGLNQATKMTRLKEYMGQTLPLKVIEVDRRRRRLILSERAARRRWRERQKEDLLNSLVEGEVRQGTVSGLADFGAFVDLGGADGLVHVSELSWDRVTHPREVLEPGQEVSVYVLRLDRDRRRIGLSLKRLQPDPWSLADERYEIDQLIKGVVTNIVDFGAFVRLEPGVEGLVHVSEMAEGEVGPSSNVMQTGDEVLARIISIDSQRKRIGLSMRTVPALEPSEATEPVSAPSGVDAEMEEESFTGEASTAEEPLADSGATEVVETQEVQEEPVMEEASGTDEPGEENEEPAPTEARESDGEAGLPATTEVPDPEESPEASVPEAAHQFEEAPEEPAPDEETQPEEVLKETAEIDTTVLGEAPADPVSDPSESEAGLDPVAGP